MAKQASILRRSKLAENKVARFFWPEGTRDWKERWDCSGPDCNDAPVFVEVKSVAWPEGPEGLLKLLARALWQLEQATSDQGAGLRVAVLLPPHCKPCHALCMTMVNGMSVVMSAGIFHASFIAGPFGATCPGDGDYGDRE